MSRKKIKFCLTWPNKTLKIFGRLRNISILLTERTIIPYLNSICRSARLLIMIMIMIILLDDLETQIFFAFFKMFFNVLMSKEKSTITTYPRVVKLI